MIDPETGKRLITVVEKTRCTAKGNVTMFVYRHRNDLSQREMFGKFNESWNDTWSKIPSIQTATYVDMQRIIRDAYRKDRDGNYHHECCTDEIEEERTVQVMKECLIWGY